MRIIHHLPNQGVGTGGVVGVLDCFIAARGLQPGCRGEPLESAMDSGGVMIAPANLLAGRVAAAVVKNPNDKFSRGPVGRDTKTPTALGFME